MAGLLGTLGRRRRSSGKGSCCENLLSLLPRRSVEFEGALVIVCIRLITTSPLLTTGLWASLSLSLSLSFPSRRELAGEVPRSLPFREPGLLPDAKGAEMKGGKAQSRFADNSSLGGLGMKIRGIGLVWLRIGGGGLPGTLLFVKGMRLEGDRGEAGLAACPMKGLFAASGLMRGGGARPALGGGGRTALLMPGGGAPG